MKIPILIAFMVLIAVAANAGDPGPEDAPAAPEMWSVEADTHWISPVVYGSNPEPEPEPGPWHVGVSGGQAEYVAVAGGRTWKDIRFEIALGYGGDEDSGTKCRRTRRHHYRESSRNRSRSCGQTNDDRYNLTASAFVPWEIVEKLSIFAGGGLGIRFVGDNTEGIGKLAAGVDVEILPRVILGFGIKAVLALEGGRDDYGPAGWIRYEF